MTFTQCLCSYSPKYRGWSLAILGESKLSGVSHKTDKLDLSKCERCLNMCVQRFLMRICVCGIRSAVQNECFLLKSAYEYDNTKHNNYLPTATCSRSAHKRKHKDRTVIFPIFCNKSQTPFAFTCSPAARCVIPTIPKGCDSTNWSWCCPSVGGKIEV